MERPRFRGWRWFALAFALMIGIGITGGTGYAEEYPDLRTFIGSGQPSSNEAAGARSTIQVGVTEANERYMSNVALAVTIPLGYTNVAVTYADGWTCKVFPVDAAYGTLVRCNGFMADGVGKLIQLQANAPTKAGSYNIRAHVQQISADDEEANDADNTAIHKVIIQNLKSSAGQKCSITRPTC